MKEKKTNQKKFENIEDFKDFSLIAKYKKKWSPLLVEFRREPREEWFIEVLIYRRASGKIKRRSLITNKDLAEREDRLVRLGGYIKEKT